MFQWMGGSRRKVTASRKSTHKRQKQYFEQKKRKLQQQPAWQDNCTIGETVTREEKNYKSLDIASLLNLTESAQECESNCANDKFMEIVNSSEVDCHVNERMHSKIPSHYSQRTLPDFGYTDRDGLLSSAMHEDPRKDVDKKIVQEFPKISTHFGFRRSSGSVDNCQITSQTNASVIDILADDCPSFEFVQHPTYESHVTFPFEDTGMLREGIPAKSPQRGGVPNYHSSARKLHTFRNSDTFIDDYDFGGIKITGHCNTYWKSPLHSPGRMDSFLTPRRNVSSLEAILKDEKIYSKSTNFMGKEDIFSCELDSDPTWNDKSSILDESIFRGSDCSEPWKKPPFEMDDFSVEFLDVRNQSFPDIGLNHRIKRRYVKESTHGFGNLGSFSIPEDDEDIMNLCRPRVGKHDYFDNRVGQTSHPSFMDEYMKELPSEESCSSSAVESKDRICRPKYHAQSFLSHQPLQTFDTSEKPKQAPTTSWMPPFSPGGPVLDLPGGRRASRWATPPMADSSSLKEFDIDKEFPFLKPERRRSSSSLLDTHNFPGFSDRSPLPSAADAPNKNTVSSPPSSAMEGNPTACRNLNLNFGGGDGGGGGYSDVKGGEEDVPAQAEASPVNAPRNSDEFGGKKNGMQMSQYTQEGGVEEEKGERKGTTMTMMMESYVLRLLLVQNVNKGGNGEDVTLSS